MGDGNNLCVDANGRFDIKTAIEYVKTPHEQDDEHDVGNFKLDRDDLVELYNLYKLLCNM